MEALREILFLKLLILILVLFELEKNSRRPESEVGVRSSQWNPPQVIQLLHTYYQLTVSSSTRVLDKEMGRIISPKTYAGAALIAIRCNCALQITL